MLNTSSPRHLIPQALNVPYLHWLPLNVMLCPIYSPWLYLIYCSSTYCIIHKTYISAHRSKADVAFSFNNRRHVTQEVRDDEMGAGMYRIVKLNKQLQTKGIAPAHIHRHTQTHTHTQRHIVDMAFLSLFFYLVRSLAAWLNDGICSWLSQVLEKHWSSRPQCQCRAKGHDPSGPLSILIV